MHQGTRDIWKMDHRWPATSIQWKLVSRQNIGSLRKHRISYNRKNSNLHPHQSMITFFTLLWDALSPYLSALDFCNSPVWNIKFDKLDFFPSLNCKIQVWNRLKIQFIKLYISNWNRVQIDRGVVCYPTRMSTLPLF